MCSLDILIVIKDNDSKRIYEYNSGGIDRDSFTFEKAVLAIQQTADGTIQRLIYTDRDYEKLQQQQRGKDLKLLEEIEDSIQKATFKATEFDGQSLDTPLALNIKSTEAIGGNKSYKK